MGCDCAIRVVNYAIMSLYVSKICSYKCVRGWYCKKSFKMCVPLVKRWWILWLIKVFVKIVCKSPNSIDLVKILMIWAAMMPNMGAISGILAVNGSIMGLSELFIDNLPYCVWFCVFAIFCYGCAIMSLKTT